MRKVIIFDGGLMRNSDSYHDLHAFSINRMNDFWMLFWKWAGIKASTQPSKMSYARPNEHPAAC